MFREQATPIDKRLLGYKGTQGKFCWELNEHGPPWEALCSLVTKTRLHIADYVIDKGSRMNAESSDGLSIFLLLGFSNIFVHYDSQQRNLQAVILPILLGLGEKGGLKRSVY